MCVMRGIHSDGEEMNSSSGEPLRFNGSRVPQRFWLGVGTDLQPQFAVPVLPAGEKGVAVVAASQPSVLCVSGGLWPLLLRH